MGASSDGAKEHIAVSPDQSAADDAENTVAECSLVFSRSVHECLGWADRAKWRLVRDACISKVNILGSAQVSAKSHESAYQTRDGPGAAE